MAESVFYDRYAALTIGTTKIEGLRIAFDIEKNSQIAPNTGRFSVWNLNPETRAKIQASDQFAVFDAGYGRNFEQVFSGNTFFVDSTHEGADWITKIQIGDGQSAIRGTKSYDSFPAGISIQSVIENLTNKLQKGIANKSAKSPGFLNGLIDNTKEFVNGFTTSGLASKELEKLCKDNGLEVSVQNGIVQVTQTAKPKSLVAFVLSSDTGLINVPTIGEDGVLKARSLLNGKLAPSALVSMKSKEINGFYTVQKAKLSGDTVGQDFFVDIEGTLYK